MKHIESFDGFLNEAIEEIKGKYAGRDVIIHKDGDDMTKWTVTFTATGKTVSFAEVLANIKF
jgi:hypothetical protein